MTPIAGVKGGQATFIGGDDIGISRDSKKADAAWNFIAWVQSDEAQIEVVAKNGNVLTRTDLANNKYIAADPRLVLFNTIGPRDRRRSPRTSARPSTIRRDRGSCSCRTRCSVTRANLDANNDAINESLNP